MHSNYNCDYCDDDKSATMAAVAAVAFVFAVEPCAMFRAKGFLKRVLGHSKAKVLRTQSSQVDADCSDIHLSDYGGTPNSAFDNCSLSISGSVTDKDRKAKEPANNKNKHEHEHLHDDVGGDVIVHS